MKSFYERLDNYTVVERVINNHSFKFVIESTRSSSYHACTIEDIEKILEQIPTEDFGDLELIVLRQPTRREENLQPVWGRLIYSYEFENKFYPAVIIEAQDLNRNMKWSKKLDLEHQRELERLTHDGHYFQLDKRYFTAKMKLENIRSTQLFRTLPHEIGHYVHYQQVVVWPGTENEEWEEWEKRSEFYHALPSSEKEAFAHAYADKLKIDLEKKGIIPFDRIIDKVQLEKDQLNLNDFLPTE